MRPGAKAPGGRRLSDKRQGRLGEAEDMAGVAAWLASDDAKWVPGQYIEASGGSGLV